MYNNAQFLIHITFKLVLNYPMWYHTVQWKLHYYSISVFDSR